MAERTPEIEAIVDGLLALRPVGVMTVQLADVVPYLRVALLPFIEQARGAEAQRNPLVPPSADRLRKGERERLRSELARYHGGPQDGVTHSHDKCRLLDELDAADEWVRHALRDRQDCLDALVRHEQAVAQRDRLRDAPLSEVQDVLDAAVAYIVGSDPRQPEMVMWSALKDAVDAYRAASNGE